MIIFIVILLFPLFLAQENDEQKSQKKRVKVDLFKRIEEKKSCIGSCCFFSIISEPKYLKVFFNRTYDDDCLYPVLNYITEVFDNVEENVNFSAFLLRNGLFRFLYNILNEQVLNTSAIPKNFTSEEMKRKYNPHHHNFTIQKEFVTKYPNITFVVLGIMSEIEDQTPMMLKNSNFIKIVEFFLYEGMTFMEQSMASKIVTTMTFDSELSLNYFDKMYELLTNVYEVIYLNFIQHKNYRMEYHQNVMKVLDDEFKVEDYTPEYDVQKMGFKFASTWRIWLAAYFNNMFFAPESNITFVIDKYRELKVMEKVFVEDYSFFLNEHSDQILFPIFFFLAQEKKGRNYLLELFERDEKNKKLIKIIGRLYLNANYEKHVITLIMELLNDERFFPYLLENIENELIYGIYDTNEYFTFEEMMQPPQDNDARINYGRQRVYVMLRDILGNKYKSYISGSRLEKELERVNVFDFDFSEMAKENDDNKFSWVQRRLGKDKIKDDPEKIQDIITNELRNCKHPEIIALYFDLLYEHYKNTSKPSKMRDVASKALKMNRDIFGLVFKRAKLYRKVYKDHAFYLMELMYIRDSLKYFMSQELDYDKIQEEHRTIVNPATLHRKVNMEIEKEKVKKRELRFYQKYGKPKLGTMFKFNKDLDFPKIEKFQGKKYEDIFVSESTESSKEAEPSVGEEKKEMEIELDEL